MGQITERSLLIVGPRRGRPRSLVRATERVEFRLTVEERQGLERVAIEERKGIATVIRDAVNEYVADYGERKIFGRRPPFE